MTEYIEVDLIAFEGDDFESQNVDIVGFDRETDTLYIEFQSSGTVYAYGGFNESTYNLIVGADSVGGFVNAHIKGQATSGARYDSGEVLTLRVPKALASVSSIADADPIQPTREWLTGDSNPFGPSDEQDDFLAKLLAPSTYGVKYTVSHDGAVQGPFEPSFEALSEADALTQFNDALSTLETTLGWDALTVKIVSVTHYFD